MSEMDALNDNIAQELLSSREPANWLTSGSTGRRGSSPSGSTEAPPVDVAQVIEAIASSDELVRLLDTSDIRHQDELAPTAAADFALESAVVVRALGAGKAVEGLEGVVAAKCRAAFVLGTVAARQQARTSCHSGRARARRGTATPLTCLSKRPRVPRCHRHRGTPVQKPTGASRTSTARRARRRGSRSRARNQPRPAGSVGAISPWRRKRGQSSRTPGLGAHRPVAGRRAAPCGAAWTAQRHRPRARPRSSPSGPSAGGGHPLIWRRRGSARASAPCGDADGSAVPTRGSTGPHGQRRRGTGQRGPGSARGERRGERARARLTARRAQLMTRAWGTVGTACRPAVSAVAPHCCVRFVSDGSDIHRSPPRA